MAGCVGGLCPHLLVGRPEAQVCFVAVVAAIEGGLGGGASRVSMNFRPTTPEGGNRYRLCLCAGLGSCLLRYSLCLCAGLGSRLLRLCFYLAGILKEQPDMVYMT